MGEVDEDVRIRASLGLTSHQRSNHNSSYAMIYEVPYSPVRILLGVYAFCVLLLWG
jgi:hypothetical protein